MSRFFDKLLWGLLLAPPVGLLLWLMEGRGSPSVAALLVLFAWEVAVIAVMRASGFSVFGGRE